MKRTKLADRKLPNYTKGEEIFNMVSHICGAAIGAIAIVVCVIIAALDKNIYGIVTGIIFGLTLIVLYTMSSIYHGLRKGTAKKVFQIIDHCSIFLLIAGTYSPVALCSIREVDSKSGWIIFIIVWLVSILGIVLNSIDLRKYTAFSMICYIGLGWCVLFKASLLEQSIGKNGVLLLVLGGLSYTIGAIFYGLGVNKKWMHSIFHLACLLGSIFHIICIALYVL